MNPQQRLLKYVLAHRGRLVLAGICSLGSFGCLAFRSLLMRWFAGVDGGKQHPADIWLVRFCIDHHWFSASQGKLALIIVIAVMSIVVGLPNALFAYFKEYLVASVTNRIGTDVRSEMYAHIQRLSLSFFHRSKVGDLMSRMSSDVGIIQQSSQVIIQVIDGPITLVGGLILMFKLCWQLTLLMILFVPLTGVAIDKITRKIRQLTTNAQTEFANVNTTIAESIHGIRIVKSFGTEDQEIKRFDRVNNQSLRAALKFCRRNALVLPSIDFMGSITVGVIILLGGMMMVRNQLDFATLMQIAVIAFSVAAAAKQFGKLNATYQQILGAAARVFELLDTKSDLVEDPNGAVLSNVQGRVEFRNVRFEYVPGEIVLDGLTFTIEPGQVVAIVGSSGAGKSTIADLIPRFYDVTGGEILVEGHNVRHIKTSSLREQIAMVPQETILFSGTIAENIAYGRPGADVSEIIDAAKAANAHEFITACPNGYETVLGEGGVGLSGGQRQRISIARALLRNPKILILDEATSSLDAASEGIVQDALDRLMDGRSTLIIAHRLSTVKNADKIMVMDKGRVIETGSFDDLVSSDGLFSQLYRTQFRSDEQGARS